MSHSPTTNSDISNVYNLWMADENDPAVPDLSDYFGAMVERNRDIKRRLEEERKRKNEKVTEDYGLVRKKRKATTPPEGSNSLGI